MGSPSLGRSSTVTRACRESPHPGHWRLPAAVRLPQLGQRIDHTPTDRRCHRSKSDRKERINIPSCPITTAGGVLIGDERQEQKRQQHGISCAESFGVPGSIAGYVQDEGNNFGEAFGKEVTSGRLNETRSRVSRSRPAPILLSDRIAETRLPARALLPRACSTRPINSCFSLSRKGGLRCPIDPARAYRMRKEPTHG